MKLSKRLHDWKANLTTQIPVEYTLTLRTDINGFADEVKTLEDENAKLRDEIKRRDELEGKLIKVIENDYGIIFAWDPLRKVWLSSCTEEYVTERERLESENAKLREQVTDTCLQLGGAWARCSELRELVRHLYKCMCNIDADGNYEYDSCEYDNTEDKCNYERLMREFGVEVEQ